MAGGVGGRGGGGCTLLCRSCDFSLHTTGRGIEESGMAEEEKMERETREGMGGGQEWRNKEQKWSRVAEGVSDGEKKEEGGVVYHNRVPGGEKERERGVCLLFVSDSVNQEW